MNMKKYLLLSLSLICLLFTACNRSVNRSVPQIDLNASYPEKSIAIQDFAKRVEYVALETSKEVLVSGNPVAITDDYIFYIISGTFYIFHIDGAFLRSFSKSGRGDQEFFYYSGSLYCNDPNEIFVLEAMTNRVLVYDYDGNFLRNFSLPDGYSMGSLHEYDRESILAHNRGTENMSAYVLISKQDGSVLKEIDLGLTERQSTRIIAHVADGNETRVMPVVFSISYLNRDDKGFILSDPALDTMYRMDYKGNLIPMISRTPLRGANDPEILFDVWFESADFIFANSVKMEYDPVTRKSAPFRFYLYSKKENEVYIRSLHNRDINDGESFKFYPIRFEAGGKNVIFTRYEPSFLLKMLEEGKLMGELKEIALKIEEDDNPVLAIFYF